MHPFLIDGIKNSDITDMLVGEPQTPNQIYLMAKVPFGANQSRSILLETPFLGVRSRWIAPFENVIKPQLRIQNTSKLLCEGYVLKTKKGGIGFSDKPRWFRLTTELFSYYTDENASFSQQPLGSTSVGTFCDVEIIGDNEFILSSKDRFAKNSKCTIHCCFSSKFVTDKWLKQFLKLVKKNKGVLGEVDVLMI